MFSSYFIADQLQPRSPFLEPRALKLKNCLFTQFALILNVFNVGNKWKLLISSVGGCIYDFVSFLNCDVLSTFSYPLFFPMAWILKIYHCNDEVRLCGVNVWKKIKCIQTIIDSSALFPYSYPVILVISFVLKYTVSNLVMSTSELDNKWAKLCAVGWFRLRLRHSSSAW